MGFGGMPNRLWVIAGAARGASAMRRRLRAVICTAATGLSAAAQSGTLPKFPPHTPYIEARSSLRALGYSPMAMPDADEVSRERCGFTPGSPIDDTRYPSGDARCFAEMEACAGTGLGPCIFTWRRGETIIEVFTVGEEPQVSGTRCRVNC